MVYLGYDDSGCLIGCSDNPSVYEHYIVKPIWFPDPDTDDFFVIWKKARVINNELVVQQE